MTDITIVLNSLTIIGLIGVLIGCLVRTLHPFVRKVFLGEFSWPDFQKKYLVILISAFGTSVTFYFAIGPLTQDFLVEFILGFLLGLAGNEAFNAIHKWIMAYFYEGKGSRSLVETDITAE